MPLHRLQSPRIRVVSLLLFASLSHPTGAIEMLTVRADGSTSGNAASWYAQWAADGRSVLINSEASDLVDGVLDSNGVMDVFVRDFRLGQMRVASVALDGSDAGNGRSTGDLISGDGRWVAFESSATNLTALIDTNGRYDAFLRDMATGTTKLVSHTLAGNTTANGSSRVSGLSSDGRYVLIASDATDLVTSDDSNGESDLFVYDRINGDFELVTINAAGTGAGNDFIDYSACFSRNGRYAVFTTEASDLSAIADDNEVGDVFLRDLVAGTTTLISVNAAGTGPGNEPSIIGSDCVSDNGRYVAFTSEATNLVGIADSNGRDDAFVRDVATGMTYLVSVNFAGNATGSAVSNALGISADGARVLFLSRATNLTASVGNSTQQLYVRDHAAGLTKLISHSATGDAGAADSADGMFSRGGDRVLFTSRATNLVAIPDTNATDDVFVWDALGDFVSLVSVRTDGAATGNGRCGLVSWSDVGDIAFISTATDLAGPDGNGVYDSFARRDPMFADSFD